MTGAGSTEPLDVYLRLLKRYDAELHNPHPAPGGYCLFWFRPRTKLDERGEYVPSIPRIDIYRYEYSDDDDLTPSTEMAQRAVDPLDELITLAHELGHHHVWTALKSGRPFSEETPVESFEEEVKAWAWGRRILELEGFCAWAEFEARERDALKGYRDGLKISEADAAAIDAKIRESLLDLTMLDHQGSGPPTGVST